MVIFDDLQKLFLYQKLNLGFDCQVCKKKFYDRIEYSEHTRSCQKDLKCTKCGKTFGHVRILQLHMQFHNVSESMAPQLLDNEAIKGVKTTDSENTTLLNKGGNDDELNDKTKQGKTKTTFTSVKSVNVPVSFVGGADSGTSTPSFRIFESSIQKKKSSQKTKEKPKPVKKQVGLTKVKMEDCLRCDACSCIYIDEKDYYKHMRNFHHKDVKKTPTKQQRSKRKCQSCCKQCRGSHCSPVKRPRASQASNLIFRFSMKDNIKNRWSQMVSQQLNDRRMPDSTSALSEPELINIKPEPNANLTIKQEPEPDLSYLLSQVEVKIKTEPPDDY